MDSITSTTQPVIPLRSLAAIVPVSVTTLAGRTAQTVDNFGLIHG